MKNEPAMISMNDFQRLWADTRDEAMAAFEAVGNSGWYILGREVKEFETALADFWRLPHAVGVASGLDAIEISLRILGCRAGDRVLTTPLSAFATTLAIVRIGAVPVFVDCDAFGLIDLGHARATIESDRSIRFFVPVHLYGHTLDLDRLAAIRKDFECTIVEDCAQSIGATHRGKMSGSVGQMAATSFYPTKNLGALGDGGAILCAEGFLARDARMWRDYGQTSKYRHEVAGYNSRLDELHASLLRRVYLKRLTAWNQTRRRVAATYTAGISNPGLTIPGNPPESESCCHLFPVFVEPAKKSDFIEWLRTHGIASAEHYPVLIPDQPAMKLSRWEVIGSLENARRISASEVSLPIHPYLTLQEAEHVVEVCNAWRG